MHKKELYRRVQTSERGLEDILFYFPKNIQLIP